MLLAVMVVMVVMVMLAPTVEMVVEEEKEDYHFPLSSNSWINLQGNINLDVYPELRRAVIEAVKREADLAKAKARIKELESEVEVHEDSFYGGIRVKVAEKIRNDALDEAASLMEIVGSIKLADDIRRMKKEIE